MEKEAKAEQVDEGDAPLPPAEIAAFFEEADGAKTEKVRPEVIEDDDGPVAEGAEHHSETDVKRKVSGAVDDITPGPDTVAEVREESDPMHRPASIPVGQQRARSVPPTRRSDSSVSIPVLEARLVEDEPSPPIVDAIPMQSDDGPSWWRRHQRFIALVAILFVAALIALLGAFLLSPNGEEDAPASTDATPSSKPTVFSTESISPTSQMQSSAVKLVPDEILAPHSSNKNVAVQGDTAVVGAPSMSNERGAAFVFVRDADGEWVQRAKLQAPASDRGDGDEFGHSVHIHDDSIVVGAWYDDSRRGSAHVFARTGNVWNHQARLAPPDGEASDYFGQSVGIYEDYIVAGARGDDDGGDGTGSAHVFVRNGDAWMHQSKLLAPDGAARDWFGISVGIYDDTIIVGARGDDANGDGSGSAHVFVRNEANWTHQAKILPPDGVAGDWFGKSVAIHEDSIGIGAWYDDANGEKSGSAHVFVRNGTVWTHNTKLLDPGGAIDDRFGTSVAIHGDLILIGTDPGGRERSGSAHAFIRNGDVWMHKGKLVAPDAAVGDAFGSSVAVHSGTALVGSGAGAAYVFSGES